MGQAPPRPLGPVALLALGLNGVVGVGIFFVPASVAHQVPGLWGASVYALTALACTPIALSFARLGSRFDEDGGPYVYARAAFGPSIAFVIGWLTYVSAIFSTAAVIRGLAEALTSQGAVPIPAGVLASATVVALALLVAVGLRITAWAWTALTVAKLLPLVVLLGAWAIVTNMGTVAPAPSVAASSPAFEPGRLLRAGLLVLFAIQGFEIIAVPAHHVKSRRWIGIATMAVLLIAGILYVGLHFACAQALPALDMSKAPMVDAARVYGGDGLAWALYAGTSVSAAGIALGMVAMSPRYLSTLGRADGLGTWLGMSNDRGVPTRALALTAVAALVLVQLGDLDELFALSSIAVLAQYGSTSASLIWMGARRRLGLGRADVVFGFMALGCVAVVMTGAQVQELLRAGAVVLVGWLTKVGVGRWRATRRGA
ncbi:MAG: APC family permease [Myxococcota bacterium]